jgi:hypothetical protein
MLQVYGVDVLDPRTSARRIAVLLDRLPPDARRFGEQWSTEAELLALLIDHVAALTWVTLKAHGAKNAPKPRPMPRPRRRAELGAPPQGSRNGTGNEGAKAGSWADAAKMLAGIPGVKVRGDGQLQLRRARGPRHRRHARAGGEHPQRGDVGGQ